MVYEIQDIEVLENVKKTYMRMSILRILIKEAIKCIQLVLIIITSSGVEGDLLICIRGIGIMDTEISADNARHINQTVWKRSSIIKLQSIESAGYQCEINPAHMTFTAKGNNLPYMEGHHALPMRVQNMFTRSLDIYQYCMCASDMSSAFTLWCGFGKRRYFRQNIL